MKYYAAFFSTVLLGTSFIGMCIPVQCAQEYSSLTFHVNAKDHAKIKLALILIGDESNQVLQELLAVIKKDLTFSEQFDVVGRTWDKKVAKKDIQQLFDTGFSLALFINQSKNTDILEWRLYDTQQASMVKGKKYRKQGSLVRAWAHSLADMVWPALTAQDGFFSTKIAYCKEVHVSGHQHRLKHVYIADYDGTNEQQVVGTPTINVAPRFNRDVNKPMLFYSESTNSNIRLMVTDMQGHVKVASNFDGVNMLPSFSHDGTKLVYCASHGNGNCQLYHYENKQLKQLTHTTSNNVSPSLTDDGTIVFYCSDYQANRPQIYKYDIARGVQQQITTGNEPCYCPSYCSKKGLLAYTKQIKGTLQLCIYDEKRACHRQLTFDEGNKDECSWSPCGNFLVYSVEKGRTGSIAVYNLLTHQRHTLTSTHDVCSYPTWSPIYTKYPVLA